MKIELKNNELSISKTFEIDNNFNKKEIVLNEEEISELASIICNHEELKLLNEQNKILRQLQESKTLEKFLLSVEPENPFNMTEFLFSDDYDKNKQAVNRLLVSYMMSCNKLMKKMKYLNTYLLNEYTYFKSVIEKSDSPNPKMVKYVEDYEKDWNIKSNKEEND